MISHGIAHVPGMSHVPSMITIAHVPHAHAPRGTEPSGRAPCCHDPETGARGGRGGGGAPRKMAASQEAVAAADVHVDIGASQATPHAEQNGGELPSPEDLGREYVTAVQNA